MYQLIDIFNNVIISKHRTLENAIKAKIKHSKVIQKVHGNDAYIPMEIKNNGQKISYDAYDKASLNVLYEKLASANGLYEKLKQ